MYSIDIIDLLSRKDKNNMKKRNNPKTSQVTIKGKVNEQSRKLGEFRLNCYAIYTQSILQKPSRDT